MKKMTHNKCITLCKQGSEHTFADTNNQDYAIKLPNLKMVLDGCGSCKFSEVGVKLFAQLFEKKYLDFINTNCSKELDESNFINVVDNVFAKLIGIYETDEFLSNNLCFTILVCIETDTDFLVFACGDGYILANNGEEIEIIKLDDGEFPKYYAYNYFRDKELLMEYKDGVEFKVYHFSKSEYVNVGVATDGFRFYEKLNTIETNKLFTALKAGKRGQIGMLINRNSQIFKDDISICF